MSLPLPEYDQLDATGLAALIAKGDISPAEALEAGIARVEARNPELNAVVHTLFDHARARVDGLPDGPLKGVPFLVKDLKAAVAGTPTTGSCKLYRDYRPTQNSVLVDRYQGAGLQIIGKTNTPEFGLMGITEPKMHGPCRNPWDLDHTPGGSSGGSSAAVAARMVPLAHSGDGGGSIRIPASHCGLVGLKPTRGRNTMAPFMGDAWQGFVQEHVLTHSVRDSALLLDITAKPTAGDPYAAPAKERPWIEEVGADPGKMRIAVHRGPLFAEEQHSDNTAAVDDAVKLLQELGHEVVEDLPPFDRHELAWAYFLTVASGLAYYVEEAARFAGIKPRARDFERATWTFATIGWTMSAADLERSRHVIQAASRKVAAWFAGYDVFLTATAARPPARVGELYPSRADERTMKLLTALPNRQIINVAMDKMANEKLAWTPNTQLFNQTGQPAISLPLYWNTAGLPIGVQFVGRFGDEATLFRLAAELEAARPWAGRLPPLLG